ncbi:MAG: 16S rRNA (cytosine(1402)-N(4))-methyltransferase, partial [Synergistaceae bacterium]|nr:16S rRNA (cytosine(1402)-N(4))-methyltransferase [Synergistaceae bacterium]
MTEHVPVLIDEITAFLKDRQRGIKKILDCTIGLGGYSRAVLEELPDSRIWGLDHDEEALKRARENLAPFDGRFVLHQGNFADAPDIVGDDSPFDAILFDLGVSNLQISDGSRGFSFQRDGPQDMRMDPDSPFSAFDAVNRSSEKELADIFWKYGEERRSRQIARGIIRRRERDGDIFTTG